MSAKKVGDLGECQIYTLTKLNVPDALSSSFSVVSSLHCTVKRGSNLERSLRKKLHLTK